MQLYWNRVPLKGPLKGILKGYYKGYYKGRGAIRLIRDNRVPLKAAAKLAVLTQRANGLSVGLFQAHETIQSEGIVCQDGVILQTVHACLDR